MIKDAIRKFIGKERGDTEDVMISIGITTFEHRFEKYFVPLLKRIREYDSEMEVLVAINGEHEQEFGEGYRSKILSFITGIDRVYPVVFPRFRGPTKLWNTLVIHATYDHVLILNDDIMITNSDFVKDICRAIRKNRGRSFVINRSWSHFLISRQEIDELGYFDERLLGIGEEDGDMTWRYIQLYGKPLANLSIKGFVNYSEETAFDHAPQNIRARPGMKYSQFNRDFMFKVKYEKDPAGIKGMFDGPVILKNPGKEQYPNECFYHTHKGEL
ncbi:MAG: hypothetical protein NTV99_01220 [Deltaproteobacteria bacterium]|nr:hypothetical protein [Deltaproteobacteria bacterium]